MTAKITKALHEVMQKVGYVQKTGKNSFHGYRYAGEADLLDKLRPAMIEAGLLLMPSGQTVSGPDEHGNVSVSIAYTLAHVDGDVWPHPLVAFGCGNDRAKNGTVGDKGVYKAITGANKYLLFKLFQIETGDDPESDVEHEPAGGSIPSRGAGVVSSPAAPAPATRKPPSTVTYEPNNPAHVYVVTALRAITAAVSVEDLRDWWDAEADHRAEFDITKGSPLHKTLIDALVARKDEIEAADLPAGQLEAAE